MKKQITIALADDHILLRNGLASLINHFENCKVVKEADDGKELTDYLAALQQRNETLPDIILLDIDMPVMNGIEASAWIREHCPSIRVIMLTIMSDEKNILRAMRTGISGYLLKDTKPAHFADAIATVAADGLYFPEYFKDRMIRMLREGDPGAEKKEAVMQVLEQLNDAEKHFLQLSATDQTYTDIAKTMKLAPTVIEAMRQSLFTKLNVKSRVGLALTAQKFGLLDETDH